MQIAKRIYHNLRLFDGVARDLQDGKAILVAEDRIESIVKGGQAYVKGRAQQLQAI